MLQFLCINHDVNSCKINDSTSIEHNLLSQSIQQLHDRIKSYSNSDQEILQCIYPINALINSSDNSSDIEINELKKYCVDNYNISVNKVIDVNNLNKSVVHTLIDHSTTSLIVRTHSINSIDSLMCIELLCQMFGKVILIKPITANPIDDTIYLLLLNYVTDSTINHQVNSSNNVQHEFAYIPFNLNGIIDFLYCFYTYGIYIYDLAVSIITSTSNSQTNSLYQTSKQEYKQYVSRILNTLKNLNYSTL